MLHPLRPAVSATVLLLAAAPASADVTADQIWSDWQSFAQDSGISLTAGDMDRTEDALYLRDVTFVLDDADAGLSGTIPEITMREEGGAVTITMSPQYRMDLTVIAEPGGTQDLAMTVDQPGAEIVASGDPDAISYDYTLPQVSLTATSPATETNPARLDLTFRLAGVGGEYQVTSGEMRELASTFSADNMDVDMSVVEEGDSMNAFQMTASLADLNSTSSGTMSPFSGMTNLSELVEAGFASEGTFTYGASSYTMTGVDENGPFTIGGTGESGSFDFALGEEGMTYGGANLGTILTVTTPQLPIGPLTVEIEESAGRLTIPVAVSDEPQDLGMRVRLSGVTVGEAIWSMFDPTGQLPRDPATLLIDIGGQGTWNFDVFDPQVAEAMAGQVPGTLERLNLNALVLELVGARLTGEGGFTFEEGPEGLPQPDGSVSLRLEGVNALLDTLVGMGILPEDQAMGARMMLGLFARPEGPDTLVSEIEVRPDGAVFANGQRIR